MAEVLAAFLKQLDECEESSCLLTVIHSLGNAGLPETVEVLMKRAELSKDSTVSEAALRALRRIDRKFITTDVSCLNFQSEKALYFINAQFLS